MPRGLSNITPGTTQSADVPTAAYDFAVVAHGTTTPVLLNLPGVTVPAGKLLQVFAVGTLNTVDAPLQVITNSVALATTAPAPAEPVQAAAAFTG